MNRRARLVALGILAMMLLVAHGFAAPVVYTFIAGESVKAKITACEIKSRGTPSCTGTWTLPDGETESGTVTGAGSSDEAKTVVVRTSVLGTYTDDHYHLWVRLIWAVVADGALIAVCVWMRQLRTRGAAAAKRLRADSDTSTQLFTLDKTGIAELAGAVYFTTEDVDATTTRLNDRLGNEVWRFTGERRPHDVRRVTLAGRDGTTCGYLERTRTGLMTNLHGPNGELVGTIGPQRQFDTPGFTIRNPRGREVGLVITADRRLVIRIARDTPEWWRALVFAKLVVGNWMSTPSFQAR